MPNTTRGYFYPLSTAAANVPADMQTLATSIDTDVAKVAGYYATLTSNRNLSNVSTVQSIFGLSFTSAATTTYELEMAFAVSTTGATSNSLGISFGGTATLTSIGYICNASQNATSFATLSTPNTIFVSTAANTTVTAAVATATYRVITLLGLIRVNAGGTLIPQLTYSAAPGAAPAVSANSYCRLIPIGTNTVTAVGAWA